MAEQSARFASTPVHARVKPARLREQPCRHKGIWWVVEGRARSVRLAHTQLSSVGPSEHQQRASTRGNGHKRIEQTQTDYCAKCCWNYTPPEVGLAVAEAERRQFEKGFCFSPFVSVRSVCVRI